MHLSLVLPVFVTLTQLTTAQTTDTVTTTITVGATTPTTLSTATSTDTTTITVIESELPTSPTPSEFLLCVPHCR